MKKLLVMTLAVAAASVVWASDCVVPTAKCAMVYQIKFVGKTTVGRPTTTVAATQCSISAQGVVRVPAALAIEGFVAYCDCKCADEGEAIAVDINKATLQVFWATRPNRGGVEFSDESEQTFIHVIGLRKNQAEIAYVFEGEIDYGANRVQEFSWNASALGTFNPNAKRFNSFKGSFAGTMDASYSFVKDHCVPSIVWDCDLFEIGAGETDQDAYEFQPTVAFGNWAMRYNAGASKAYSAGRLPKFPSWATVVEFDEGEE